MGSIFDNSTLIEQVITRFRDMRAALANAGKVVLDSTGRPALGGSNLDRDIIAIQNMLIISLLEMIALNTHDTTLCLAGLEQRLARLESQIQEVLER